MTATHNEVKINAAQRKLNYLIEDIEFLVNTGESPSIILQRIGSPSKESLLRRLNRANRNDLALYLGSDQKHIVGNLPYARLMQLPN